ncbi:MAG: acyltransferase [Flavobacteriales bacterium]|jgi:peptidoglycan/LPS O-acetylase OafA/YrhL|nr:acyltransferase [Flavobacteriales bacterium]
MGPRTHPRIFGLDLVRALAALLVVYSHADDLLDAYWPRNPGAAAMDGVDLFFVLSGFLIGNILIRLTLARDIPWWRRLIDFWQRRWLRTLPNYYLFLLINIGMVYMGWSMGLLNVNTLAYFAFLQNFIIPLDLFFWESWSLAVEEWFYLLFPLLLVALAWWRSPKWGFLAATLIMIATSIALRYPAMDAVGTPFTLDLLVRKIVVYRFDTIGYGVLVAWLVYHVPAIFSARRVELFLLGLLLLATAILLRSGDNLFYMGTLFLVLSGSGMALTLPFMAGWQKAGRWSVVVTFLSRISYALYLVHIPVRSLFLVIMPGHSLGASLVLYVGYWLLCIALAAVIHHFWERPFMGLRDGLSARILGPVSRAS